MLHQDYPLLVAVVLVLLAPCGEDDLITPGGTT